jgi:exodeoxyribonuclease V alpha subunit
MTTRSTETLAVIDAKGDTLRMLGVLDQWVERGWLRSLDAGFARFLWTEEAQASPLLVLAAALASHQLGRGHVPRFAGNARRPGLCAFIAARWTASASDG